MLAKMGSKKRFWSVDEKRTICLQTKVPGVSVVQVARRYAMNAGLIHKWLHDPRFAGDENESEIEASGFLRVELEGPPSLPSQQLVAVSSEAPVSAQRVDITLSDGRRILVEGTTALPAVLALVEGLMP